jgi:hypothetical protein
MDKAEKYDIKEASNPSLTASARKNYADNAQHNVKTYGSFVSKHSKQY